MDDLFMLDDMDLAVPPLDNALMDDYIMELANMSTTPTHMQGESDAMLTVAVPHARETSPRLSMLQHKWKSLPEADGLPGHLRSGRGTSAAELQCTR